MQESQREEIVGMLAERGASIVAAHRAIDMSDGAFGRIKSLIVAELDAIDPKGKSEVEAEAAILMAMGIPLSFAVNEIIKTKQQA